jgi:hypothetical protein
MTVRSELSDRRRHYGPDLTLHRKCKIDWVDFQQKGSNGVASRIVTTRPYHCPIMNDHPTVKAYACQPHMKLKRHCSLSFVHLLFT